MDRPFTLSEGVDSWNTIIFLYRSALKEVSTKVEILNDDSGLNIFSRYTSTTRLNILSPESNHRRVLSRS